MSSPWVKAWKNTPRIDCGLCGAANCATFARLLVVGELAIEKCPILNLPRYANTRMQLEFNSGRQSRSSGRPAPKLQKGGMLLSRPCRDNDEKVMAELRVFNGVSEGEMIHFGTFDPQLFCNLLGCISSAFGLVKCSRDLGYGRVEIDDLSITILQDGRINMRRVRDEARVLELFGIIERCILGSVICNCCGSDLFTVLLGLVEPKGVEQHPALRAGSSFSLVQESIDKGPTKLDSKDMSSGCLPSAELDIRKRHKRLLTMIHRLREGSAVVMDDKDESFPCDFVGMLKSSTNPRLTTSLLIFLGTGYVQQNAMKGLQELSAIQQRGDGSIRERIDNWLALILMNKSLPAFSESWPPEMILSYAHVMRVFRAIGLLTKT